MESGNFDPRGGSSGTTGGFSDVILRSHAFRVLANVKALNKVISETLIRIISEPVGLFLLSQWECDSGSASLCHTLISLSVSAAPLLLSIK